MTPILATLFDKNYAARGLALIRSLQRWHTDFRLFVLALDDATECAVNGLDDDRITVARFSEYATADLRAALVGRTTAEACYTMTPDFTRAVMQSFNLPHVTYVDSDSFLFAPLDPFYAEIGDASVAIIPHRFPERMKWREQANGIYNVNMVFVRNDETGRACVNEWAEAALAWCYNRTEHAADGSLLFAEQGYLDAFPAKYNAHVIQNIGLSIAPWNQEQYEYQFDNGNLFVIAKAGTRVIAIEKVRLYHFHSLREKNGAITQPAAGYTIAPALLEHIYKPYGKELMEIYANLKGG